MKATFATVALLVLALSWAGSGAVEVQVSKQVPADACLGQRGSMKEGPGPRQQILTLQRCGTLFTFIFSSLQENGLTFSLEAVQRLQELAESGAAVGLASPRLRAGSASLCGDPLLPQEFLPLCRQRGASASMGRLGELRCVHVPTGAASVVLTEALFCVSALVPMDLCEICAFVACTGC